MNLIGLAVLVTFLGFTLAVLTIFFIIRGTSIPAASDKPHTIRYGALEISTDRVVMLLIVSVIATSFPLGGFYYLTFKGFTNVKLVLHASIQVEQRKPVRQAKVIFQRKTTDKFENICESQTVNGEFLCEADLKSLNDVFHLSIQKDGYADVQKKIIPTEPDLLIALEPYMVMP